MSGILMKQAKPKSYKMGLEERGIGLFENAFSTFDIPFTNNSFGHGLNKKEQKIVEDYYGWQFDNPEHRENWMALTLELKHTINPFDPKNNPTDLLTISVAKEIGYAAANKDEAEDPMKEFKFQIYNETEELATTATYYQKLDEAIMQLQKIKSEKKYLLAIAKFVLPNSSGINNNMEKAYTKLREYINGDLTKTKNEAVDLFLKCLLLDKTLVNVTVDFREAYKKNIIRTNAKNEYYNAMSKTVYGKNEETAINYLLDVKNQQELGTNSSKDQAYSIRYQLKNH